MGRSSKIPSGKMRGTGPWEHPPIIKHDLLENHSFSSMSFPSFPTCIYIYIVLAKSYPYSKADHIPCENSSGNLGKNDWPLMVKIKFCDPCQARLFSCHVLSCPRARVQPQVRSCESMVSQIIFLDRICRRVFFINRSGRSGHWGEGLKANRELGQVWKITLPLEPK